jgi:hypothetical protein
MVADMDGVRDAEAVMLADTVGDTLGVNDADVVGLTDREGVVLALCVIVGLVVVVGDSVADMVGLAVVDAVGDGLGEKAMGSGTCSRASPIQVPLFRSLWAVKSEMASAFA